MEISPGIIAYLTSATQEVFEMMVFEAVEPLPSIGADQPRPKSNVVATVAFAGHRRGFVAGHSSLAAAGRITGSMLGMPVETIDGEMPDAIGELANMIAGTFRNKLASVEPSSAIAVPTVTIGSDFSTFCTSRASRIYCPFMLHGEQIHVELVLSAD